MEVKDVLQLPWKKVTDWSELIATFKGRHFAISEDELDTFVDFIFSDISRKLQIPYDQLYPILKEENRRFYSLKEDLFFEDYMKHNGIEDERSYLKLIKLQNALIVPDTDFIGNKVQRCERLFIELSDAEKLEFLNKIGKINIKIEYCE